MKKIITTILSTLIFFQGFSQQILPSMTGVITEPLTMARGGLRVSGGILFKEKAKRDDALIGSTIELSYLNSNPDSARLQVSVDGVKYYPSIADWQLIPIANYSSGDNELLVTAYGELIGEELDTVKDPFIYDKNVYNTVLGLRLFQMDVMLFNLRNEPWKLYTPNGFEKAPLMKGEENFDSRYVRYYEKLVKDADAIIESSDEFNYSYGVLSYSDESEFDFLEEISYRTVIADEGSNITFFVRNNQFMIGGDPNFIVAKVLPNYEAYGNRICTVIDAIEKNSDSTITSIPEYKNIRKICSSPEYFSWDGKDIYENVVALENKHALNRYFLELCGLIEEIEQTDQFLPFVEENAFKSLSRISKSKDGARDAKYVEYLVDVLVYENSSLSKVMGLDEYLSVKDSYSDYYDVDYDYSEIEQLASVAPDDYSLDYYEDQTLSGLIEVSLDETYVFFQRIEEFEEAQIFEILHKINPSVVSATYNTMKYSAFFRWVKENNPENWKQFISSLPKLDDNGYHEVSNGNLVTPKDLTLLIEDY